MTNQLRGGICAGTREAAPSIGLFDPLGGLQAHAGYRLRARTDRQARHLTALITDQHQAQHISLQFPRSQGLDRSEEKLARLAQPVPARCQRARSHFTSTPAPDLLMASSSFSPARRHAFSDGNAPRSTRSIDDTSTAISSHMHRSLM